MSNNFISALEEQFNKDCKVINIRYEYEGYSGTERYIIASCLTEKEIWINIQSKRNSMRRS